MKKILPLFICAMIAVTANAQTFYAQGGVNFANISTKANGDVQNSNMLTTFNVGFMNQFGLSKVVDLEAGLLLMGQGAKSVTNFPGNAKVTAKFNPLYLQVPVNLLVKVPLASNAKLFFNAGPYIAVGVGGKSKIESTGFGAADFTSTSNIKFSNDDPSTSQQEGAAFDRLKRFDYGINAGAGVDFGNFILKANYGLGLAKISSIQTNNSDNDKNKYRTVSVSVGIPLNR